MLGANYEVYKACPPGRARVRRMSELINMRLASCNIGSLAGKSTELVKVFHRCRISVACIQETTWVGAKARGIDGYK